MIKVAICDDELIFRERISEQIEKCFKEQNIECEIDCFSSGEEFLEKTKGNLDYLIVFLDITMKDLDGIETARRIRLLSANIFIVFVTAYISYALEGYEVNATRYLLKDDRTMKQSIRECIKSILTTTRYQEQKREFEFQSGKHCVALDKILYVESKLHKVYFYILEDGVKEYCMYDSLNHVQTVLNDEIFYRIHQSFLVNMKHVIDIKRYYAQMAEGTQISISKKYYKQAEVGFMKQKGVI